jgi:hypothetical protein
VCYNVEMTVHLRQDAGTDSLLLSSPSAFPLTDDSGAKLYLRGDFPHYYVTNGCCGCGSIEGPRDGPGRLLPDRFISYFLAVFPVGSVELLWWWGDKPRDPPRRPVTWPEFVHMNDGGQLESRIAYLVHGKPHQKHRA